jgi:hypothetical protein
MEGDSWMLTILADKRSEIAHGFADPIEFTFKVAKYIQDPNKLIH